MRRRLLAFAAVATGAIAIAVPAPASAATVSIVARAESGVKGPSYDVPVLSIAGDATAERIELAGPTQVRGDVQAGAGCTQSAPDQVDCGTVADVSVSLGAGDDRFVAAPMTTPATVDGGPGADGLDSQGGRVSLSGGEGDDMLRAVGPSVSLTGGPGADRLESVSPASVSWADETGSVDLDLRAGTARTPSGTDTLIGDFTFVTLGKGDDRVVGSDLGTSIFAGPGADVVLGGGGKDRIAGDEGDDIVSGGAGDDELFGGSGADRVSGGDGDDELNGDQYLSTYGWTGDWLTGDKGADVLTGRGRLSGGDGDDRLVLPGDGGRRLDQMARVGCGRGHDVVDAPGAHMVIPGDCERVTGAHKDESSVTVTRTPAGGRLLSVRGPRCRRTVVVSSGGRRRVFVTPQPRRMFVRVVIARPSRQPTLVSLTRCDNGRVVPILTFGR